MKVMVISPKNKTVFNFRGDLIKEFIKRGCEVVVTGPNREYVEDIEDLGASFIEIPFVKDNIGIKGDIEYCKKLSKAIEREKPDKIFSYTIKPVIYGSIAARRNGVKEVYPMITGLGRLYTVDDLKTKILRFITGCLYKYSLKDCKKVIFQNYDDMNLFLKKGYVKKEQCKKVDGSGVNMERFSMTALPDEKIFLMVSRIIKEKGVFEFCEAAKKVKGKYPEARFVLLGGYDSSIGAIGREELKKYIENGTVEIPGEVKDVAPILKGCYAFVLPTYYREGIPRTILEAMACGRPVLTTDWVGTREAVADKENGYLVPIKNSEALAEKMLSLIESPETAKKMGEKSYEVCKAKFDVKIINDNMLKIFGI